MSFRLSVDRIFDGGSEVRLTIALAGLRRQKTCRNPLVCRGRSTLSNSKGEVATQDDAEPIETVRPLPGTATNGVGTGDRNGGEARR